MIRLTLAPELDEDEWPVFKALPSTRNITIENWWSRWLKVHGRNCQAIIKEGKFNGLFNPNDEIDVWVHFLHIIILLSYVARRNLFQWLCHSQSSPLASASSKG